eukprot:GSMAST32.ASY1.ANO1.1740.1 assembled CDS
MKVSSAIVPSTVQTVQTQPFPQIEREVTDWGCQICHILCCPITFMALMPGVIGKKIIRLEAEEAVLETTCICCNETTRRPYGELGSVDKGSYLCCVGVASNLTKSMPICPGNGCDTPLVLELVEELKARMKSRGDTGQIQRSEALSARLCNVESKIDQMMTHMGINWSPPVDMNQTVKTDTTR